MVWKCAMDWSKNCTFLSEYKLVTEVYCRFLHYLCKYYILKIYIFKIVIFSWCLLPSGNPLIYSM